jgi:hypothetical protein
VRIKLTDRLCERVYPSNLVSIAPDLFAAVSLVVSGAGQTAQLLMYVYLPDYGFGVTISSRTVTLTAETACDLLPTLDFTDDAGMRMYIYFGYARDVVVRYSVYTLVVDPACDR